jgi:hypothetical protein
MEIVSCFSGDCFAGQMNYDPAVGAMLTKHKITLPFGQISKRFFIHYFLMVYFVL